MPRTRFASALPLAMAMACLVGSDVRGQAAAPLTDKITDLRGHWKRDPARHIGGICGVPDSDQVVIDVVTEPPAVLVQDSRVSLDGSATTSGGRSVVATTDAGWLKLTTTVSRPQGFTNVMQEVYILNRDRNELTVWRTLNVVRPDGSSGKIDCGNRSASVYTRVQP